MSPDTMMLWFRGAIPECPQTTRGYGLEEEPPYVTRNRQVMVLRSNHRISRKTARLWPRGAITVRHQKP